MQSAAHRPPLTSLAMRLLPRRLLTEAAGVAAAAAVPVRLRQPLYSAYARAVGADLSECREPLSEFGSFNAFFTRELVDGARRWGTSDGALCSPADGRLDATGRVVEGRAIQAKGIDYAVSDLVADDALARRLDGGLFLTVYLSPADYHRVHTPAAGSIRCVRHIAGDLWPVNGLSVPFVDGLFRTNERAVIDLELEGGRRAAVVLVGALIVGGIELAEPRARRTTCRRATQPVHLDPAWQVEAGGELGAFLLGSTVVVVIEDPDGEFEATRQSGDRVRVGETLVTRTGRR